MLRVTIEAMNCVCKPGRPCAYHAILARVWEGCRLGGISLDQRLAAIDGSGIPDQQHEAAIIRARACRRVWNKWESGGGATDAAQDWAMDLISEYAEHDGIELKRIDAGEG